MAQRVKVILEDDLTGEPAHETVKFALDGSEYEIDLSTDNAAEFRKIFDTYIPPARRITARKKPAPRSGGANTKAIREWALANGYKVSDRGRIHADVVHAYTTAHSA